MNFVFPIVKELPAKIYPIPFLQAVHKNAQSIDEILLFIEQFSKKASNSKGPRRKTKQPPFYRDSKMNAAQSKRKRDQRNYSN